MNIQVFRVMFYAKAAQYLIMFSEKIDSLSHICIWKWYNAMKKDPRTTPELLDSVYNDPSFNKIFKRFENGKS